MPPLLKNHVHSDISVGEINDVHNLTCDAFRLKLIEQFDILFKQNKILWPRSQKCIGTI